MLARDDYLRCGYGRPLHLPLEVPGRAEKDVFGACLFHTVG